MRLRIFSIPKLLMRTICVAAALAVFTPGTATTQVAITLVPKRDIVRRHIKWNTWRPDLREDLVHLFQDIKRRVCGIASAAAPWFSV